MKKDEIAALKEVLVAAYHAPECHSDCTDQDCPYTHEGWYSETPALKAALLPTAILSLIERVERAEEALSELADLMDAIREGDYEPDSFTTQPARMALAALFPTNTGEIDG